MKTLISVFALMQKASGKRSFQRLLPTIIMVVALIIIIAIMISTLLIGCLVAACFMLLQAGMAAQTAIIIIAISTLLTIMILVFLMLSGLKRLRRMPQTLLEQSPLASRAMDTLDAFTAGLMAD